MVVEDFQLISAQRLDIVGEDVEKIISNVLKEAEEIAKGLSIHLFGQPLEYICNFFQAESLFDNSISFCPFIKLFCYFFLLFF